jgi:hypothetical protein
VILEAPESRQVNRKRIKAEPIQTRSTDDCDGGEKRARSKHLREASRESRPANRTLDDEAVGSSEGFPASNSLDVVCTGGQKWLVEDL